MRLTKAKNLQKGEALIAVPKLHWIVLVRPLLWLVLSVALCLIVKLVVNSYSLGVFFSDTFNAVIDYLILVDIVLSFVCFLFQIPVYLSTEYYITNKRLLVKRGFLSTVLMDMPIERVESLVCTQKLLGRLLNYGTVSVSGIGGMFPRYHNVKKPYSVRRTIDTMIERNKAVTLIREESPRPLSQPQPQPVKPRKEALESVEYGIFVKSYPAR
jgi:uncharacterized membrane protein YdbT with pleckstrin-like domain